MSDPYIGEIRMFAGNFAPRGWASCDGQLLQVSQFDALFSLLGTIYGGDGRTTFGLPDLRGRIPVHAGSGPGLTNRPLGQKSGSERATIATAQLPSHNHPARATRENADTENPTGAHLAVPEESLYRGLDSSVVAMAPSLVQNAGGGQTHANVQPFQCVYFIIALSGVYPSRQ